MQLGVKIELVFLLQLHQRERNEGLALRTRAELRIAAHLALGGDVGLADAAAPQQPAVRDQRNAGAGHMILGGDLVQRALQFGEGFGMRGVRGGMRHRPQRQNDREHAPTRHFAENHWYSPTGGQNRSFIIDKQYNFIEIREETSCRSVRLPGVCPPCRRRASRARAICSDAQQFCGRFAGTADIPAPGLTTLVYRLKCSNPPLIAKSSSHGSMAMSMAPCATTTGIKLLRPTA